jgi:hypothetical protein
MVGEASATYAKKQVQRFMATSMGERMEALGKKIYNAGQQNAQKWADAGADYAAKNAESIYEDVRDAAKEKSPGKIGALIRQKLDESVNEEINKKISELEEKIREAPTTAAAAALEKAKDTINGKISDLEAALQETVTKNVQTLLDAIVPETETDAESPDAESAEEIEKAELLDKVVEAALAQGQSFAEQIIAEQSQKLMDYLTGKEATTEKEDEEEVEEVEEEEEGEFKVLDLALTAGLSLNASHKSEITGANKEVITNTANIDAGASVAATILGAEKSGAAEGHFTASLQRRYTDGKLTGAQMTRIYKLTGTSGPAEAVKILSSYGMENKGLIEDFEAVFQRTGMVTLYIDAELTQKGLREYEAAVAGGKMFRDTLALSDRRNYRNHAVRAEVDITRESIEHGIEVSINAQAVVAGGKASVGYKTGASGRISQTHTYRPRPKRSNAKV